MCGDNNDKSEYLNTQQALKTLNFKKVFIPIGLGVVITLWLFTRSGKVSFETLAMLNRPNWYSLLAALGSIILRELGHIFRIRLVSGNTLSLRQCFFIAVLWEFASAVTPSVVGGGIVAVFIFAREGLSMGRAIAYVIVHGILDNTCFLLSAIPSFFGSYNGLFDLLGEFSFSVKSIFFVNYLLVASYMALIFIGFLYKPKVLEWILMKITSFWIFKRFRKRAYQLSQDIAVTACAFRGYSLGFWLKSILYTILTWGARYALLVFLIASYVPLSWLGLLDVVKKQIVMWTLMLVPLAPGGSGIAELLFQSFFETTLEDYTLPILILWRSCSFYLYLVLGLIFLPKWLKKAIHS